MVELLKLLGDTPYDTLTKTVNQHADAINQHKGVIGGLALFAWIAGFLIAVLLVDALLSSRRIRKLQKRLRALETMRMVSKTADGQLIMDVPLEQVQAMNEFHKR
jgi:hypothetical protein